MTDKRFSAKRPFESQDGYTKAGIKYAASQPPSGDALREADLHDIQHQHRDGTWWYCAATPAPLDVERLARAIKFVGGEDPENPDGWEDFITEVARAYAEPEGGE